MDRRPDFPSDFRLVLASQSPRRHSLLRELGIPFTIAVSEAAELLSGKPASDLARANALAKVRGASLPPGVSEGAFVLGTDTLVGVGRRVMGKPASAEEAAEMLAALSGRTHRVVSGVALIRTGSPEGQGRREAAQVAGSVTYVTLCKLDQANIDAYVASGEWRGKAGAYAVQGLAALFVCRLRGEYSNVVGLPLHVLYRLFRGLGFDLLRREWLKEARAE
jgi:septum formation protein